MAPHDEAGGSFCICGRSCIEWTMEACVGHNGEGALAGWQQHWHAFGLGMPWCCATTCFQAGCRSSRSCGLPTSGTIVNHCAVAAAWWWQQTQCMLAVCDARCGTCVGSVPAAHGGGGQDPAPGTCSAARVGRLSQCGGLTGCQLPTASRSQVSPAHLGAQHPRSSADSGVWMHAA